ncbi:MAG: zinc-ribbon domain-containing protein [Candidatus Bathyarchaeota archaeon]|nr:zinc-ribbon domain-containing protein [Candidatus Bathyarchaeota archaeon]
MPYCTECGAKVEESAKFCPSCGTTIGRQVTDRNRKVRVQRRPISALVVFLVVLVVGAAIIVALATLPVRTLDVTRSHTVPYIWAGVDTLNVDLSAVVAGIEVAFETRSLMRERLAVSIDVYASARVGLFGVPNFLNLISQDAIDGNVQTVTSEIELVEPGWPSYFLTNVTCIVRIDPSLNTSINIKTVTGGIVVLTRAGVVLESLSLEATTGGIEVELVKDVVVSGDISLNTETGGIQFSWENVFATRDVLIDATSTTGGVDVDVKQDERLGGNITIEAEAVTGGVNFGIDIQGDIAAKIDSSVTTGGIDIDRQVGFSLMYASPSPIKEGLWSENWKTAGSNFYVGLKTTTGDINIDAEHTP